MSSVLKDWVQELPLMMQGTLMTCIRGNDLQRASTMKPVTRWLRSLLLNNGNPENDFMDVPKLPTVEEFEHELEYLSIHYFAHFLHSLEIVGYKHPDSEVREIALNYYDRLVDFLHLLPEPEEHLDFRLSGQVGSTGAVRRWRSGERMAGKVLESLQIHALQRKVDELEARKKSLEERLRMEKTTNNLLRAEQNNLQSEISRNYGRRGS